MGLFLSLAITSLVAIQEPVKRFTIGEGLITLEEFGKRIQKESGIQIEVPKPYRERKLDIFVKDLDLSSLLKGVGDALRGKWVKTSTGFRFEIETQQRNLEDRLRAGDRAREEAEVQGLFLAADALKEIGVANLSEKSATAWVKKRSNGISEKDAAYQKFDVARDHLLGYRNNGKPLLTPLTFFGAMNQDERRRFLEGEVFYSSRNGSNLQVQPNLDSLLSNHVSGMPYLVTVRCDPESNSTSYSEVTTASLDPRSRPNWSRPKALSGGTFDSSEPELIKGTSYEKELKAWENESEVEAALDVRFKNLPTPMKGVYKNGYFRNGDILRVLHAYAGVNCLAEGNREVINGEPLKSPPSSAYELLRTCFNPLYHGFHLEKPGKGQNLLVVRYASHWRAVLEPNEALLRTIEAKVIDGKLAKEDWADLAAQTSLRQFTSLNGLATKLPAAPDATRWFAYRLYGSLNSVQRKAGAVPIAQLSASQQFNARQFLLRCLHQRSPFEDGLHELLMSPEFETRGWASLSLFIVRKPPTAPGSDRRTGPDGREVNETFVDELRIGMSIEKSVGIGI